MKSKNLSFPLMPKIEQIFHFMNNFYIPFSNSLNYATKVQENKIYEQHIQIIWNEFCQGQKFQSLQKQSIEILNSGQWNIESGPDFNNAKINIDGKIKQGKIEIHLTPELWYTHGHHWNAEYDDIILHVVWGNPRLLEIPPNTPIIEIQSSMQKYLTKVQAYSDYPHGKKFSYDNVAHQLKHINDQNLQIIFQSAGLKRLLAKSYTLTEQIISSGIEQTFYQNFMEVMGYKNNRQQFLQLAKNVPIEILQNLADNHQRQALLWGYSNLLPQTLPSHEVHQELKPFVDDLWKTWWALRTGEEPLIQWSRQAQRPTNSPERRLAGSFIFFAKFNYDIKKIIKTIEKLILDKSQKDTQLMLLLNDDCQWQSFYNFIKKSKSPVKLIGKSRCDDLLINLFIPFIIACNNEENSTKRQKLMQALLKVPKLQNNIKLNLASNLFFVPPKRAHYSISNAIEQQGILQLLDDYQNFSGDKEAFWAELNIILKN